VQRNRTFAVLESAISENSFRAIGRQWWAEAHPTVARWRLDDEWPSLRGFI